MIHSSDTVTPTYPPSLGSSAQEREKALIFLSFLRQLTEVSSPRHCTELVNHPPSPPFLSPPSMGKSPRKSKHPLQRARCVTQWHFVPKSPGCTFQSLFWQEIFGTADLALPVAWMTLGLWCWQERFLARICTMQGGGCCWEVGNLWPRSWIGCAAACSGVRTQCCLNRWALSQHPPSLGPCLLLWCQAQQQRASHEGEASTRKPPLKPGSQSSNKRKVALREDKGKLSSASAYSYRCCILVSSERDKVQSSNCGFTEGALLFHHCKVEHF